MSLEVPKFQAIPRPRPDRPSRPEWRDLASAVLETMDCLVIVLDSEGKILHFNRACQEATGYTLEEVRGKRPGTVPLIPPEELPGAAAVFARLAAGERSNRFENHWLTRDGRRILVAWTNAIRRGPDGSVEQVIGTGIDITERRRAEEALRESEQRFRLALASSPVTVFSQDRNLRFLWMYNPVRGTASALLGKTDEEALSPRDVALLAPMKQRVLETGARIREEVELDGEGMRGVWDVHMEPLRSATGAITGLTCAAVDITERKRLEQQVHARARQHAAVAELGHRALRGAPLSSLFDDTVRTVAENLQVSHSTIVELSDDGVLRLRASVGWPRDFTAEKETTAPTCSLAGHALAQGAPVTFEDLRRDTRFEPPDVLLRTGITSGVVVLVPGRDRPFGILTALTTARRSFTHDDVSFLQSIANVVGAAMQRQNLEKVVLEIAEEEQRRIGRDLHDSLCQHLSGIGFLAHGLEKSLAERSLSEARQAAEIARLLCEASGHAREIARGLAPVTAAEGGLVEALRQLAASVRRRSPMICTFRKHGSFAVPDDFVAGHLFRIAQEAVSNAVKHSRGRRIHITLGTRDDRLTLRVSDDGVGLPDSPAGKTGMGLHTMRYRAAMINARLDVEPAPRGGTAVICSLEPPLDPA